MARPQLPPAETIRLIPLAQLAHGGMGTIELARAEGGRRDGQLFAVKRPHDHLAKDPQFVAMFLDEAWMTAALKHPNIINVAAWGTDERGMFLAVELAQGVSLHGLVRSIAQRGEQMPGRMVAFVGSEICAGLAAAHDLRDDEGAKLGLVHRDLTASNVLVTFEGDVKIADFGIAKARARITQTETGTFKGKPGCMAPEQARGQAIDHRADLFSFGVLMFELLAGRRPWIAESMIDLMLEAAQEPAPDLTTLRADCDPVLASIAHQCLEKDPGGRPSSALEIKTKLDEWRAEKGFIGGERAALAKFIQRTCEPQAEWFKRALKGDFASSATTTFKEIEAQSPTTAVSKDAPRRSASSSTHNTETSEARGTRESTPMGTLTPNPSTSNTTGVGRFSFVARWASPARDEPPAQPTTMPRPSPPPKPEPTPVKHESSVKKPEPTTAKQESSVKKQAPTTAKQESSAKRPEPTLASPIAAPLIAAPPKAKPQETLRSNEVIPDLMRMISGAQAAAQRPPQRPPATVKVTSATVESITNPISSDLETTPFNAYDEEPSRPAAEIVVEQASATPRDSSGGAKAAADSATGPATPRDASAGAQAAPAASSPPATPRDASVKAKAEVKLLSTPKDLASDIEAIPTPKPAAPPPVPFATDPEPEPPPKPALSKPVLAAEQLIAAHSGKSPQITLSPPPDADEDVHSLPQPTMKSPPVASGAIPAPQPAIDIRVSAPSPLPPSPHGIPSPTHTPSGLEPPRRRTDPGRTRISAIPVKPAAHSPTAKPAQKMPFAQPQGPDTRTAIIIALVALILGALLAFVLRGRI